MTLEELLAYVRGTLADRPLTVADYVNAGRAFVSAALADQSVPEPA